MKKLMVPTLALLAALLLNSGCATDGTAKIIRELAKDPATIDMKILTPWGVAIDFHRAFPTNVQYTLPLELKK